MPVLPDNDEENYLCTDNEDGNLNDDEYNESNEG